MAKKTNTKNKPKKKVNNKKVANKRVTNSKRIIETSTNNEVSKVVKCIIIVLIILLLVYLLTLYITKNSTDSVVKENTENTTIQYDEILVGTSFKQSPKEYLVLFYNVDTDINSTYYTLKSDYEAKDDALPIYYVDLGSKLNSDCISAESNENAKNASELKINDTTLIKFTDNKISEYIVGGEEISNYLK